MAWTPQLVHCECVHIYLCRFGLCRGYTPAEVDRNGQQLAELARKGQQGAKTTPKYRTCQLGSTQTP